MDTLKHFIAMQENPEQIKGALRGIFTAGYAIGQEAYKDKIIGYRHELMESIFNALLQDPHIMENIKPLQTHD